MKTLAGSHILLAATLVLAGCGRSADETQNMQPIETRKAGDLSVVLLNDAGELKQGQNSFLVQFRDPQGQPVDVGEVQLGSSMFMPGMAPMSGDSEITPTGRTGTYHVKSSFAMSGAWRFTISWNGPRGRGNTSFHTNVR